MRARPTIAGIAIFALCLIAVNGAANGQATRKRYVLDFGAAFTQATVSKARTGLLGLDMYAGKMLTSNLCVGVGTGYDIVSFYGLGETKERLAMIPILAKIKFYFTLSPMLQVYASAGGGVYRAQPHLSATPIGDIWYATNQPGGAVGFGASYWFLLTQGIGLSFEYHFLTTDADNIFSYFAMRLDYSIIKF